MCPIFRNLVLRKGIVSQKKLNSLKNGKYICILIIKACLIILRGEDI